MSKTTVEGLMVAVTMFVVGVFVSLCVAQTADAQGFPFPGPGQVAEDEGLCSRSPNMPQDFDSGAIGTDWIPAINADQTNCPWTIESSQLRHRANSSGPCNGTSFTANYNQDVTEIDQWGCFTYDGRVGNNYSGPGVAFRADTANESVEQGAARVDVGSSTGVWASADNGPDMGNCETGTTMAVGVRLCARMSGTGASSAVEFWVNPSGVDPDNWGPSVCCINEGGTDLRGTTCNAATRAPFVGPGLDDSGGYMGVRVRPGNVTTNQYIAFGDYDSGTCQP